MVKLKKIDSRVQYNKILTLHSINYNFNRFRLVFNEL